MYNNMQEEVIVMEKCKGQYNAKDLAYYFLHRQTMTQKKLHKMLYYAYAWYLYVYNEKGFIEEKLFVPSIIENGFQGWVHGPVYRELYPEFKRFSWRDIDFDGDVNIEIKDEHKELFDFIFERYGKYTGDELENSTHQHSAWINARKGYDKYEACKTVLSDVDIFSDIEKIANG